MRGNRKQKTTLILTSLAVKVIELFNHKRGTVLLTPLYILVSKPLVSNTDACSLQHIAFACHRSVSAVRVIFPYFLFEI